MYPEGARLRCSVSPPQARAGITHREEVEVGRQPVLSSSNVFVCIYSPPINAVTPRSGPISNGSRRAVFQLFADLCKSPYRCFLLIVPCIASPSLQEPPREDKDKSPPLTSFCFVSKHVFFFSLLR